jgi:hypothetical protein
MKIKMNDAIRPKLNDGKIRPAWFMRLIAFASALRFRITTNRVFRKTFAGLSQTAKVMCAAEGILFIFLLAAGWICYFFIYPFERPLPYAIGLLAGCALSGVKIILLEKTLARAVDLGKQAKNYASLQAILRYFGTIAAVAPAFIFRDAFGVYGVVAGLLTLQFSAFIASRYIKTKSGRIITDG